MNRYMLFLPAFLAALTLAAPAPAPGPAPAPAPAPGPTPVTLSDPDPTVEDVYYSYDSLFSDPAEKDVPSNLNSWYSDPVPAEGAGPDTYTHLFTAPAPFDEMPAPLVACAHRFENTCFWVDKDKAVSWMKAKSICEERGMTLASVRSVQENNFIADLCGEFNTCWLGLSDTKVPGTYTWSDGTLPTYTNWKFTPKKVREMRPESKVDCVSSMNVLGEGAWNPEPCDEKFGVVCQSTLQ